MYKFPWQYHFPPFFTIQINSETLKKQMEAWRQLTLDYLKTNKQSILDVREAQNSRLFTNEIINRKLPVEGIIKVMECLRTTGNAEPIDNTKNRWYIYWEPLEELSSQIYLWAVENQLTGTVCTFYEIIEGEDSVDEVFHNVDEEILIKALKRLELEKKAEVIISEDTKGVKFF